MRADHAQVIVEQRIEAHQERRDDLHLDPAHDAMLDLAQDRYERALGWTHD